MAVTKSRSVSGLNQTKASRARRLPFGAFDDEILVEAGAHLGDCGLRDVSSASLDFVHDLGDGIVLGLRRNIRATMELFLR